jgi:hypothetical protein
MDSPSREAGCPYYGGGLCEGSASSVDRQVVGELDRVTALDVDGAEHGAVKQGATAGRAEDPILLYCKRITPEFISALVALR